MAVKLRLMRMGAKKRPFYRIVAADSRGKRDGKYIELVKDSGNENKFVLKIANSISYHMTLRKRAHNKSTTDKTGWKILESGEIKIDKISRNSRGQISTTEIYKGSATWDFADIEAVPNSVYEYYIQEIKHRIQIWFIGGRNNG